jgi:hypothetical protein
VEADREKLCERVGPVAPSVRAMFRDQRATHSAPTFFRDTQVGRMIPVAPHQDGEGEEDSEGEEGGRRTPQNVFFFVDFLCFSFMSTFSGRPRERKGGSTA